MDWTPESLSAFERDIADTFNRGEIKAPVHLAGGNERQLIDIFRHIRPQDWVCCAWRAHYHCLLKGVPPDHLKAAIMSGQSIALCFPEQRIICSGIVGGIAPYALGLAWAAKRRNGNFFSGDRVYCFLGDMTNGAGIVAECRRYAMGHELPAIFIVEDNGKSVGTDTKAAWGTNTNDVYSRNSLDYQHELTWPHVGTGKFVRF